MQQMRKQVGQMVLFFVLVTISCQKPSVPDNDNSGSGFTIKAVDISPQVENNSLSLFLKVHDGYGVQKKGKHVFFLYALNEASPNYNGNDSLKTKIQKAATPIEALTKVTGETAQEDEKYYSTLYPLKFMEKLQDNKKYALKAKIYVCSFANGFCSVQNEFIAIPSKGKK